jgi:hypothetical protein
MRSRNVDEVPGDADVERLEQDDPVLVLDLYDSSERWGSGSGGTSGDDDDDDDDDGPPRREDRMFTIERWVRIEGVGAIVRVGASEGEGAPR